MQLPSVLSVTLMLSFIICFADAKLSREQLNSHEKKRAIPAVPVSSRISPLETSSEGPWIVRIDKNAHQAVTEFARDLSAKQQRSKEFRVKHELKRMKNFHAVVVEGISMDELLTIPGVISVHEDGKRYMQIITPSLPTWGQDRIDQASRPLDGATYSPMYQGCGVDVYVLDTGIDTTHQEFSAVSGVTRTVSNIWNSFGDVTTNTDDQGHGTHVAGTVGGNSVGVSPCANIYGMKILDTDGSGYDSDILAAMEEVGVLHQTAADNGGNPKSIINMSLGGSCFSEYWCKQDALNLMVNELAESGVISAVAAGNNGQDAKTYSPASAANAITVGASDSSDAMTWFSNYGKYVDIFAPGDDVISACSSTGDDEECVGQLYVAWAGTSMATPHVAGVLAQQMERMDISPSSLADVESIRSELLCSASLNQISGVNSKTTKTLLQVPESASDCAADTPVASPTVSPTAAPTKAKKTKAPTRPPTRKPSKKPTRAPTTSGKTRKPTKAKKTKAPTNNRRHRRSID